MDTSGTILDFLNRCLNVDEARRGRQTPDVEAKRKIIDLYKTSAAYTVAHGAPSNHEIRTGALADVIQVLAEAYADRPGWREEWQR